MTEATVILFDARVVAPILFLIVGAISVLVLEIVLSRRSDRMTRISDARPGIFSAVIASLSLGFAVWFAVAMYNVSFEGGIGIAGGGLDSWMLRADPFTSLMLGLIGAAAIVSVWLAITYLQALHIHYGEYYALLLLSVCGMFVALLSVHLLAVFVGVELMSLPLYALAGFDRRKQRSNEAAAKFFLTGSIATALMLFGMALLYGATGRLDFAGLQQTLSISSSLATVGLGLVLVGFVTKLAAVPFHQWAPDVYEGSPAAVTALISVSVVATAFGLLLRFLTLAVPLEDDRLTFVFWVLAAMGMGLGSLMSLIQTNVKRLLAYSSIAHAGMLMMAFAANTQGAYAAGLFYLFAYVVTNLGAYAVVVTLAQGGRESASIDEYAGLARVRPGLAAATVLFSLSLAGIPGTVGFSARLALFSAVVNADDVALVVIAAFSSVASLVAYMRLPVAMFMREPMGQRWTAVGSNEFIVLAGCAAAVLYYGFFFDLAPFEAAVRVLVTAPVQ